MLNITCPAEDDPARIYSYCPSFGASIFFTVLFFIATLVYTIQSISLRFRPAWVLVMAGLWELGGYISRSISITQQTTSGIYTAQFLLILLAPLWINAFVYMVFGHMIHFFLLDDRVFGIRARRITMIFVLFDITAFVVQLVGGLMTSGTDIPIRTVELGLNIYTGGVALQLAFIASFIGLTLRFRWHLNKQQGFTTYGMQEVRQDRWLTSVSAPVTVESNPLFNTDDSANKSDSSDNDDDDDDKRNNANDNLVLSRTYTQARPTLRALWLVLSLIVLRNLYRLIEYAMGGAKGNTMTRHEAYQYVFDAVPMFFAMIMLIICNPGRILRGYRSDFQEEDKARKFAKKAKKMEKKEARKVRKEGEKLIKEQKKAERKSGKNGAVGVSRGQAEMV